MIRSQESKEDREDRARDPDRVKRRGFMIDPERLIGGLLNSALGEGFGRKKKRSKKRSKGGILGGDKALVGMGLLGLAFAAYDHYQQKSGGSFRPSAPGSTGSSPPPPPAMSPPPPPGATTPPPPPDTEQEARESEALLILRAMIAAANADYTIDSEEREGILLKAREAGLSEQEMSLIAEELDHPKGLADIAREVRSPQQAEEVYVASLLAVEVDTEAEKAYLKALAQRLDLSPMTVQKWCDQFEVSLDSPPKDVID
ncbi:MAG: tellurite resistance TerB family protein [Candidatus Omnitrophica bacterium]|nr:tellurite resistance TerB family protein [Candidatus Omnitrophota bacterium]